MDSTFSVSMIITSFDRRDRGSRCRATTPQARRRESRTPYGEGSFKTSAASRTVPALALTAYHHPSPSPAGGAVGSRDPALRRSGAPSGGQRLPARVRCVLGMSGAGSRAGLCGLRVARRGLPRLPGRERDVCSRVRPVGGVLPRFVCRPAVRGSLSSSRLGRRMASAAFAAWCRAEDRSRAASSSSGAVTCTRIVPSGHTSTRQRSCRSRRMVGESLSIIAPARPRIARSGVGHRRVVHPARLPPALAHQARTWPSPGRLTPASLPCA